MQRLLFVLTAALFPFKQTQAQVSDSTSTLFVSIGQDSYFGFYANAYGTHKLTKSTALTIYANYWANPAYGSPTSGTDFWTEFGMGVDFASARGKLHINPAIGVTYGKVLSGGEKGVLGDGIVPSVLTTFSIGKIQTQVSATYFKSLRHEGPVTTDFVWSWINSVYAISPAVHAGVLVDHFYMSRSTGANAQTLYLWMGPLIQVNFPHDATLKISGGYDKVNREYVKIILSLAI